jgi:carbonic anhydrase
MHKIMHGNKVFREKLFKKYQQLFQKLNQGQEPEALFITCSDSRIDPTLITQTQPGDLFVLRNAGNIVPLDAGAISSEAATIEFAIQQLGVKYVVICGHSGCGAIAAIMEPNEKLPYASSWLLRNAAAVSRFASLTANEEDRSAVLNAAAVLNVRVQLANLKRYRFVREKVEAGQLELHGWFYDLTTGAIRLIEEERQQFLSPEFDHSSVRHYAW